MHGEAPGRLWKTSRSDHAYGSLKGIRLGVKYNARMLYEIEQSGVEQEEHYEEEEEFGGGLLTVFFV